MSCQLVEMIAMAKHILHAPCPSAWTLVRRQTGTAITIVAISMLGSFLSLMQPTVMEKLIESLTAGRGIVSPLSMLVATFIATALTTGVSTYLSARFKENGVLEIREGLIDLLLKAPILALGRRSTSELSTRLVTDPPFLTQGVTSILSSAIASSVSCIGAVIACLYLIPTAFIAATLCASVALFLTLFFGIRVRDLRFQVQASTSEFSGDVQAVFDGISSIRHYGVTSRFENRLLHNVKQLQRNSLSLARSHALVSPLTSLALNAAFIVALLFAAAEVAKTNASLAQLVSFTMYFQMVTSGFQEILTTYISLQEATAGRNRIEELRQHMTFYAPKNRPSHPAAAKQKRNTLINFNGVCFSYDEKKVINGASFSIPRGVTTAIVGPSGAGKTTLLNLIEGFLVPDTGTINGLLGHRDGIGFVDQASTVIKGSIADNVRFERPGITDERICEVLGCVGLSEVATLEGIHRDVQPRGQSLSGGEKQRLVLARALACQADTLILDEPTSNVDGLLEQYMLNAIEKLAPNATVIVVAHRPATVRRADHLIFINGGVIKEEGSPNECLIRSEELREILGDWGLR
ncbi:ABC transporter ATP-binding protein [Actinomyces oris]|uniref:ABC transporter ATP-binding protein n=1 Tax=Actinomyces oris TaxID=544580 RepID=UPI000AABE7EC|nr:ABC transporter ATP-binding protein [Actinomyces oris]